MIREFTTRGLGSYYSVSYHQGLTASPFICNRSSKKLVSLFNCVQLQPTTRTNYSRIYPTRQHSSTMHTARLPTVRVDASPATHAPSHACLPIHSHPNHTTPPPSPDQKDRHFWKHYIPATSFAGGARFIRPVACVGSGDPVRVLCLYTTNTLDEVWSIYCWDICTTCRYQSTCYSMGASEPTMLSVCSCWLLAHEWALVLYCTMPFIAACVDAIGTVFWDRPVAIKARLHQASMINLRVSASTPVLYLIYWDYNAFLELGLLRNWSNLIGVISLRTSQHWFWV